jgi:hypothetical protein
MTQPKQLARWRGLAALATDLVEHGSAAIERVHLRTAARPFRILEQIPLVALPARAVHVVHDGTVVGTYAAVRIVNRLVRATLDAVLERSGRANVEPPRLPPAPPGD